MRRQPEAIWLARFNPSHRLNSFSYVCRLYRKHSIRIMINIGINYTGHTYTWRCFLIGKIKQLHILKSNILM